MSVKLGETLSVLVKIQFVKMSANGNDFVIFTELAYILYIKCIESFAKKICSRRLSVGADGLIVVTKDRFAHFELFFFNSNGSYANVCGNGIKCVAKYLNEYNFLNKKFIFRTSVGIVKSYISNSLVKILMPVPKKISFLQRIIFREDKINLNFIDLGILHVVIFIDDLLDCRISEIAKIVFADIFFINKRVNVNFVKILSKHEIFVRTYERGVNEETLSCGTGNIATACICSICYNLGSPLLLKNKGGCVDIYFDRENYKFRNVYLQGKSNIIYNASLLLSEIDK